MKKFDMRDEALWNLGLKNNEDPYGRRVYEFAADWAALMEEKMREGAKLEDIAKATSHEADTDGITGYMYGAAVNVLSQVWEHGERLRRWHNHDCQIHNEGEIAN